MGAAAIRVRFFSLTALTDYAWTGEAVTGPS